jgi:hypothetical protein
LWKGKHLHAHTVVGKTGIHPHFHTVDSGKGYNVTSKLLLMEKDTSSVHHVYIVDCGKIYTVIHSYLHPCRWRKGIHPHVFTLTIHPLTYTLLTVERYTLLHPPLLVKERDKPSCSY